MNVCMKFSLVETSDLPEQIDPNANTSYKNMRVKLRAAAAQQTPATVSTLLHTVLITLSINFY